MVCDICLCKGASIGYSMSWQDVMDMDSEWFEFFWEEKVKAIEEYNIANKG